MKRPWLHVIAPPMADDRRRTETETTTTQMTTPAAAASEAYDALSSYTCFLRRQNEALVRALQMSVSSSSHAGRARSTGGRNNRRRTRAPPVRRPTRTYIAADPADFRLIVQQATGAGRVPEEAVTSGAETNWRSDAEVEPQPVDGGATAPLDTSALRMHSEGTSDVGDVASGNAGSYSAQPWFEFDPFVDFPSDGFM